MGGDGGQVPGFQMDVARDSGSRRKPEKMKTKFRYEKCSRCPKLVYVSNKSFYGLDKLKAETPILCDDCATPQEKAEINLKIGRGIAGGSQPEGKGKG